MFAIQPKTFIDKSGVLAETLKPNICAYYIMPKYSCSLYDMMNLAEKN